MPLRRIVVDASVVVKWFLPEASHHAALRLLRYYQEESLKLFAPALLIVEASNVFCKRVRRLEMSAARAKEAYRLLKINSPILVDDHDLMDEAMHLSLATGQSLHHCPYLALALRQGCELITADHNFQAEVVAGFPNVVPL